MPISIRRLLYEAGLEPLVRCQDVVRMMEFALSDNLIEAVSSFFEARWLDWDGKIIISDLLTWMNQCPECECYVYDASEILYSCAANISKSGLLIECTQSDNLRKLTNDGIVDFSITSVEDIEKVIPPELLNIRLQLETLYSVFSEASKSFVAPNLELNVEFFVFETEPHLRYFDVDIIQPAVPIETKRDGD